nr:RecName: Full=Non-specific lipid-transfer protein P2; Short=LTP P2 [Vitis sp.]P80275.1 RecName: Full=Non-specific lipid-transfer protein P1; Short=LTP P1 [Vitis sp.]
AITCGQVSSALSSCLGYLKNGGAVPPGSSCGIKNLNSA